MATADTKTMAIIVAVALLYGCAGQPEPQVDRLQVSRAITTDFAIELQQTLTGAIQARGVKGAVGVCSEQAQAIAQRVSQQHGVTVGRTSARLRNPENAPSRWQADVVGLFAGEFSKQASPASGKLVEYFAEGSGGSRYMRAIPTAPLCTACHGAKLSPEVAAAIHDRYPRDAAIGYEVGELRGAFYVVWDAELPIDP